MLEAFNSPARPGPSPKVRPSAELPARHLRTDDFAGGAYGPRRPENGRGLSAKPGGFFTITGIFASDCSVASKANRMRNRSSSPRWIPARAWKRRPLLGVFPATAARAVGVLVDVAKRPDQRPGRSQVSTRKLRTRERGTAPAFSADGVAGRHPFILLFNSESRTMRTPPMPTAVFQNGIQAASPLPVRWWIPRFPVAIETVGGGLPDARTPPTGWRPGRARRSRAEYPGRKQSSNISAVWQFPDAMRGEGTGVPPRDGRTGRPPSRRLADHGAGGHDPVELKGGVGHRDVATGEEARFGRIVARNRGNGKGCRRATVAGWKDPSAHRGRSRPAG